jgi:small subunit ribosomal protein S9
MTDTDLQPVDVQPVTVVDEAAQAAATAAPRRDERVFTATYSATGRRKSAIARVVLTPGAGAIVINGKPVAEYLPTDALVRLVNEPFAITQLAGRFDVRVRTSGGGFSGQAGAVRHGISRALSLIDEATRKQLKAAGMITRDARIRERKKYGQPGARKRFQFSKR